MFKQNKVSIKGILACIGALLVVTGVFGAGYTLVYNLIQNKSLSKYVDLPSTPCVGCLPYNIPFIVEVISSPRNAFLDRSIIIYVSVLARDSEQPNIRFSSGQPVIPIRKTAQIQQGYPYLEAQLSASAFDIDPQKQDLQLYTPLQETDFVWTITPKYVGQQTLVINLSEQIQSPAGFMITHTLAIDSLQLNVDSNASPFLSWGQITLGDLFVILLGSVLNVPWVLEQINKKREKNEKTQLTSPPSVTTLSSKSIRLNKHGKTKQKRR